MNLGVNFGVAVAVRCEADDRQRLERLCRHITRPAPAYDWLQCNAAGRVVLKLKTPWRDGTTHLVMSPLEFMQRLAALVPSTRLHLIRFHGVLAPNAKLRAQVVPARQDDDGAARPDPDIEITESLIMEDIQPTIEKLHALRALGIDVSIDDFRLVRSRAWHRALLISARN